MMADTTKLTAEERQAVRQLAAEKRRKASPEELAQEVLDKIESLPEPDRAHARKIHEIVTREAPQLAPKTYYGSPAYADAKGKVVLFFQEASKFKVRYGTLAFTDTARVDDGGFWPTSWAVVEITPAVEEQIAELVRRAVS
jgi:uncharacterized protein YdhG (YjbR/CyaY superfamily)